MVCLDIHIVAKPGQLGKVRARLGAALYFPA